MFEVVLGSWCDSGLCYNYVGDDDWVCYDWFCKILEIIVNSVYDNN